MSKVSLDTTAPDLELADFDGHPIKLANFRGKKNVILIFNRGFQRSYCRAHLAQLRQDYDLLVAEDTEVIAVGPENTKAFEKYFSENDLPFVGLPDPKHTVLKRYGQEIKIFKFGRMPAQVVIDKDGIARYVHYGNSMSDIPENVEVLEILRELNQ